MGWSPIAGHRLDVQREPGQEAFDGYRRICPACLEEESEVHETEPCVYAQTVTGQVAESNRVQIEVTL